MKYFHTLSPDGGCSRHSRRALLSIAPSVQPPPPPRPAIQLAAVVAQQQPLGATDVR